ncbi:hypothetical protein, variant 3 [Aphanomyces astaci]|uniref:Ubiquitin-fold modifier-conjugating enzyme 1 n=1 Tax=Aphanomyces astaci TaxID=112090 RepID=W4GRE5_APHAT|nr:hypothetical protein, variant 3 [Aphanomyces astaci]ETV82272.1 hypothetical protein, variant 3 [Aphanomyces astaci]|eukprot:XP_009827941.1 hypothetical protein, variant 3 [Aphanomyces astaci]
MTTDEVDPPLDERTTQRIPVLNVRAGPRDGGEWIKRLKEEYTALIHFVKMNKEADGDWFTIASDSTGTRWTGTCWTFHDGLRYEFGLTFDIPATYPVTHPEIWYSTLSCTYPGEKMHAVCPTWTARRPKCTGIHTSPYHIAI